MSSGLSELFSALHSSGLVYLILEPGLKNEPLAQGWKNSYWFKLGTPGPVSKILCIMQVVVSSTTSTTNTHVALNTFNVS